MRRYIKAKIKQGYTQADLCQAIDNYSRLGVSAPGYGNWGLTELMRNTVYFDSLLDDDWEGFVQALPDPKLAVEPEWPEWEKGEE